MIRNYIFDFGNVLARFSPEEMTAACVPQEEEAARICPVVFDRLYWDPLDAGTITDDEIKADFAKRLPPRLAELACQVYDRWICLLPPIAGMQALVRDIKNGGGRLYLLSNISVGFGENYSQNPWVGELFSLFDGLVFSGTVGLVKPKAEIFEHLLSRFGLQPEECIFIDDSPINIAGAAAVGIKGYLFDGDSEKLRKTLEIPVSP